MTSDMYRSMWLTSVALCRSVFENAIDMAHIHYLHNDTFGNQVLHATSQTNLP